MSQSLVVQEFGIIVAIKDNKPAILNPDFLKYTGIVPSEWELARQPVFSSSVSQVTYTNGVSIIAETNRVIFVESLEDKKAEEISVAAIAERYVKMLPNAEYQGLGVNPRGYKGFESADTDAARRFMSEGMFAPGAWQQVGTTPMRSTINLVYTFERAPLYLTLNEAALRNPDETSTPIVLFSGSYSYEVSGETASEKLTNLLAVMSNWKTDLQEFSDIINDKFLGHQASSRVPDVFTLNNVAAAV
ncbi:hypothetical protein OGM63_19150 [Plectonema radiosum NIES-515]|uniref:Uncharacterized protein n=1 Tax=Plectonema radiosum NIES-515 TaxID=2986073 RepID=A0ABT3B2J6_9CYAN|nr:hypothetical protein [Plectonema radiosum]MCV3215603.1 hypothetical protein [Plectonema radiosum NIES-515]